MMHESFLKYERFRYLKLACALCLISIGLYLFHSPDFPPNGGTWLGYTLGTISAGIIVFLLWLGIRKRQYGSTAGTVRGWLSAHVYLGTALIVIATLHTGFQLGWNIHTLAYTLMMLVIFSGFYGLYVYVRYPTLLSSHRGGLDRLAMLREIQELDENTLRISEQLSPQVHEVTLRSIEKSRIGTSAWQQLTALKLGNDPLEGAEKYISKYKNGLEEEGTLMLDHSKQMGVKETEATMIVIGNALNVMDSEKLELVRQLLETVGRKKSLVKRVRKDIQLKAIIQLWLYFHVPLSIALFAALLIHITTVFYYW